MQNRLHLRDSRHVRRPLLACLVAIAVLGAGVLPASAQDTEARSAKVLFTPLNDSGIDGSASLRRRSERTDVDIWADGAVGDHPTHIHQGSCDDLDPNPEFPLTNVQLRTAGLTGTSTTTIDVPLTELLAEPHLILIHKSADDIGTYYACGDIVAGRLSAAEQRLDGSNDPLPGTGAGDAVGSASPLTGGALAGAFAALAVAVHLVLLDRRRISPLAPTRSGSLASTSGRR